MYQITDSVFFFFITSEEDISFINNLHSTIHNFNFKFPLIQIHHTLFKSHFQLSILQLCGVISKKICKLESQTKGAHQLGSS
ncbi:hypothetical protein HanRHA438_Chr10g0475411 [Helianthus annuus]|uniref:Uncharacterized protein n=1 Tax=Helianthus annuus TaxID=4232 RepID=A0A251TQQ4_HELAN|nr:hypothetical protein HanXRQr2_Chr10g0462951 [Helianthus annuus]KAJ0523902.1 hypothetical protein HanIR_Chr10g0498801 [Helianthus annuus]KAJ0531585.1 hypothetical protein HanHA89_Chr10g0402651 [Helianthus annuus]KAJ0698420.1 hypothetical protein HanLR1_Chr10g0379811 [Helianthus annuus]KAJ0701770.1 hypothetical protein HanOQP8_Chr10g0383031 [Helianthus annuus]